MEPSPTPGEAAPGAAEPHPEPADPTLDELLALAPGARAWAAAAGAGPADLALALDLGARLLRSADPGILALLRPGGPPAARGPAAEGSASRGARGEEEIYDLLSQARPVRDVSRRARSGDLLFDTSTGPVLVEVKNYATTVPGSEVDKFLRDLRARDAAAGVLLSLASPIAGVRAAFSVALEPRVSDGALVPVVYAAPRRPRASEGGASRGPEEGGPPGEARLDPDLALAAVDVAAALAEVYPRGVRGLHGRDAALAYAAAADQLADGVAAVRTDLARALGACAGDGAALGDRLVVLGRNARDLAAAQRAEAEEVRESRPDQAEAFVAELGAKYPVRASAEVLAQVVRAVENTSLLAGLLGEENRWRLLKARAVHVLSGCSFSFLKGATSVRVPLARLSAERVGAVVAAHPKKVHVADGELGLELDEATLGDALGLVDAA